ncbi:MAG TPA: hypothetical protein VK623_05545 [Flavobacterium sp.]|nr:hypothetical protein [Flavobacterium sp.]
MTKITSGNKLRYKFDNLMSKGPMAMIALLGLLSLLVVILAGFVIYLFGIGPGDATAMGFVEGSWQSLMRTLDSGTMGGDEGWSFRIVAFCVTLGGIFIISTLIGVLSSGIEGKLEEMRKGRSFVIEKDHTLILGWSSKVFTIISELCIAGENQKKPRIVILADKDKVEMEDEIRDKIGDLKNMKVICRSGSPNDLTDLNIANPYDSKSIIIMAPETGNADSQTIKTILAITNNPNRRSEPYHIVAEIKDKKSLEVARMVGKNEVELILTDDVISRIMVQTSRQSGLSIVYQELMDFDGAEIYFNEEKLLVGKTFAESLFAYEDSTVLGLQYADGAVKVNPPMEYVLQSGDKVIAITEDDDTLIVNKNPQFTIDDSIIVNGESEHPGAERTLLLGWNGRAQIIIRELDNYVGAGSYIKVVSAFGNYAGQVAEVANELKNIKIEFAHMDTTAKDVLDSLDVTGYNSVQVLCYKDDLEMQEADSNTLITLLHLRRICEEKNIDLKIVSEMLDLRNRDLAEVTKADDFIVSDKLISLMMSQVSENKKLMQVFEDLLDSEGSEIYLKPVVNYIKPGEKTTFYTLLESARRKGEIAIGYRIQAQAFDSKNAYGVTISPQKGKEITFTSEDRLIVVAED